MKEIWEKIKSKIPVSRGRYNRELSLLTLSVNRTIAEEKSQLQSMIHGLYYVTTYQSHGDREIALRMRVTDDLLYFCKNPYQRQRLLFQISEDMCKKLEKELA